MMLGKVPRINLLRAIPTQDSLFSEMLSGIYIRRLYLAFISGIHMWHLYLMISDAYIWHLYLVFKSYVWRLYLACISGIDIRRLYHIRHLYLV